MFFEGLLNEFWFEIQLQNYSQGTIDTYCYNVTLFIMYVKEMEMIWCHCILRKFIKHQQPLGNKASYISSFIKSLRTYLKYLDKEEYLYVDIIKNMSILRGIIDIVEQLCTKGISVHVLNIGLLENSNIGKFFLTTLLAIG